MKIGCIATSRVPSDTANSIQVMKTCQALTQIGHEVSLFVPGDRALAWNALSDHYGLDTPFLIRWLPSRPAFRRYDFALSAVGAARRAGADLLYVWALQAAVAGQFRDLPICVELHGPPEGRIGPLLFRRLLAMPGQIRLLPITQALVDILETSYGEKMQAADVVLAPNGVDLERFRGLPEPHAARKALQLPEVFTAGYTGHLYAGRGMELLEELAARFPEVQFLWVGGRPGDVMHWRRRLLERGLDNVRLTGFVDNQRLPLYQAASDVLLMPYERFIAGSSGGNSADYCSPMKLYEYLACGRPIISSDLPAIREVLNPELALLCPPEKLEAWAVALSALLKEPEKRLAFSRRAGEAATKYTWQVRAERCLAGWPPAASV